MKDETELKESGFPDQLLTDSEGVAPADCDESIIDSICTALKSYTTVHEDDCSLRNTQIDWRDDVQTTRDLLEMDYLNYGEVDIFISWKDEYPLKNNIPPHLKKLIGIKYDEYGAVDLVWEHGGSE